MDRHWFVTPIFRSQQQEVGYVSVQGEQAIDLYGFDSTTDRLTKVERFPTDGRVAALAIHPSKEFLYASLSQDKRLQSFVIDPEGHRLLLLLPEQYTCKAARAILSLEPGQKEVK